MQFENFKALYLLCILPVFAWLFWISWRHFLNFQNLNVFSFGSKIPSWRARIYAACLKLFSLLIIIFALAEPCIIHKFEEKKYKNVRLFFLVDVSGSMIYANDVQPNRLAAVRDELSNFYGKLDGSYETSIIPFAGEPNPYYCPLTYSKSVVSLMTGKLNTDSAPTLGTNITLVFNELDFQIKKQPETGVNIVVLITDGGKEESESTDRVKLFQIINKLSNENTKIYSVGVGGAEAVVLAKRDKDGNFLEYIMENNKIATSQIDEDILKQISTQGNGDYLRFNKGNQLYDFLNITLKDNRVFDTSNIIYTKIPIQCWLFALASLLLWVSFIVNFKN